MSTYHLSILTPEGTVFSDEVRAIVAPGQEGAFGVLRQHAPMIAAVRLGVLKVDTNSGTRYFVLGEGILEVSDNGVGILADNAEAARDLDAAKKRVADIEETFTRKPPSAAQKAG